MPDSIRSMRAADAEALAHLMHRAIHEGAAHAYTQDQRDAWSPAPQSRASFLERVSGQSVLVGEDEFGVAGFFTLTNSGILDLAFVRPDRMGDGLALKLHEAILNAARTRGRKCLFVDASHLARRFLERQGWVVLKTQTVAPRGVPMQNHRMRLDL